MIIVSYDIADAKLRSKFSHYLLRFGRRLQFSVYEIENSDRILKNISADIQNQFMPNFTEKDSVLLILLDNRCEIIRMGYAAHEDEEMIVV